MKPTTGIVIGLNIGTICAAAPAAFLGSVGVMFGLNDGPPGKVPVPAPWSLIATAISLPVAATAILLPPATALAMRNAPAAALCLTAVPYLFALVTVPA